MDLDIGPWIIGGLAFLAVIAAITDFVRTPSSKRYKIITLRMSIEEQLQSYPPSAQAVIIRGSKRLWLIRNSPLLLFCIMSLGLILWQKSMADDACTYFMGLSSRHIALLYICYALPSAIFVFGCVCFKMALKALRSGYFPPLDSILFVDTIASKGLSSKIRSLMALMVLVCALWIIWIGHSAYIVTTHKNTSSVSDAKCPPEL